MILLLAAWTVWAVALSRGDNPLHLRFEIEVPFYIRLEGSWSLPYARLCPKPRLASLESTDVTVGFDAADRRIDNSGNVARRSVIVIEATSGKMLTDEDARKFLISDSLRILNRLIASYQAVTGAVSNAGYIEPLGLSDIQLFANLSVDGQDIRDRWPGHSTNTFPLDGPEVEQIQQRMLGARMVPELLFSANARVLINRGQYSLAVVQAAVAAELRITRFIVRRLRGQGQSKEYIDKYRGETLGTKVWHRAPDPRSLEVYCTTQPKFKALLRRLRKSFTRLRGRVVHEGHLASQEEAMRCVRQMSEVFQVLSE